ncbi:MAG: DUF2207 domain-containing protein, partial [Coriobacteriia bacterium]|nr:DUF2207 domain-containing protein [Coriobacteriia bacterium]
MASSSASRRIARIAIPALLALAMLLVFVQAAHAKTYYMGPLRIGAVVQPDGSLLVEERRTFTFEDDFTFVYWDLDESAGTPIEIMSLAGPTGEHRLTTDFAEIEQRTPGTYQVEQFADMKRVTAYFRAQDEIATFTLRYRVQGAATRWSDTGELYWKFVGDRWDLRTRDVAIGISLPTGGQQIVPGENVRAWAHGPLEGSLYINDNPTSSAGPIGGDLILMLSELPSLTFVEARAVFPAEWLSDLPPGTTPMLDTILAEEGRLAEEANTRRTQTRRAIAAWTWLPVIFALGALVASVWAFFRYGREHPSMFTGKYYREDPADLHPAVLGVLWRFGEPKDSDLAATIMHLANAGVIHMEPTTVS